MNRHALYAIVFTDIVNYSAQMGKDEELTMKLIQKNRKIHKSIIKKHRGKWHKEMGDGTLSSFPTISNAVYCAGELIKKCQEENIVLRIGIHQGEIIKDNGDIYGNVLNIASRIESLAKPGEIWISHAIYSNIKNKPSVSVEYIDEKSLKNISDPVKVYSLTVNGDMPSNSSPTFVRKLVVAASLSSMLFISYCSTILI